jgi:hypothetical protein
VRQFIASAVAFAAIVPASTEQHGKRSYRGRGDHIIATWKLDAAGAPTEYEGHGKDYTKAPIKEQFEVKDGKARWNG